MRKGTFGLVAVLSVSLLCLSTFQAHASNGCRCWGDANKDGFVDTYDLHMAQSNFGKRVPRWRRGDVNGDRMVNSLDVNLILASWGCRCIR